jgi:hypothetical protein
MKHLSTLSNRFLREKTLNTNNVIQIIDFDCALGH